MIQNLVLHGSIIGIAILGYGCVVGRLSKSPQRKNLDRAIWEFSELGTTYVSVLYLASTISSIWGLIYLIGHLSIIKGVIIWVFYLLGISVLLGPLGFLRWPGLHILLAGPALIVGLFLTVLSHPF